MAHLLVVAGTVVVAVVVEVVVVPVPSTFVKTFKVFTS